MTEGRRLREELNERLAAGMRELRPDDPVAEAGRTVLLVEFRQILAHEDGSRSGEDVEDLHQMRVAMRRTRSIMRLLRPWYRRRVLRRHARPLRNVMRASGPVRDLDVLREQLAALAAEEPELAQRSLVALDQRRRRARGKLLFALYSLAWEQFLRDYGAFLVKAGAGAARRRGGGVRARQMNHVLPLLVQQRLTRVRAYGPLLRDADVETLHDLRIECKALRYALSTFAELLGPEAREYVRELKRMQDLLGRMNDIAVADDLLTSLMPGLDFATCEFLKAYGKSLAEESELLRQQVPEAWERFNSRETRRLLADALLDL